MDLSIEIRYSLMDPYFHTLIFFPWNWYLNNVQLFLNKFSLF